jgi:hypothetical protein
MSLWMKLHDHYCYGVIVPGSNWDFLERDDRLLFVKQVATINQAKKVLSL